MATGGLGFFILTDELVDFLNAQRRKDTAVLILEYFFPHSMKIVKPDDVFVMEPIPNRITIGTIVDSPISLTEKDLGETRYRRGWPSILMEPQTEQVLYAMNLGYKSPDDEGRKYFQRVKRSIRKALQSGVICFSEDNLDGALFRDLYYSIGAERAYHTGVLWKADRHGRMQFRPSSG